MRERTYKLPRRREVGYDEVPPDAVLYHEYSRDENT